ncbi:MAG: hydrogenase maturation protein HypF [Gammaproteobacteria bacterium]|jgi:hydrogenase maturation protein HypF
MIAENSNSFASDPAVVPEQRLRLQLEGMLQGVGFRPFVHRLATALGLNGWVLNTGDGVSVDIEGTAFAIADFLHRLSAQLPPLASIERLQTEDIAPVGYTSFTIRQSTSKSDQAALMLPDVSTCQDCLHEIRDPTDRRYAYPFTNCTNCGPRFSILETLPYDRVNTTMRNFTMCTRCQGEFENSSDRRFHAQANACPDCGPQLRLLDQSGVPLANEHQAILHAAEELRNGMIVALKGLGGFQLLVDARNDAAVVKLRRRKMRPEKPFAIMAPSLKYAEIYCHVSKLEQALLSSAASPIVLLQRRIPETHGIDRLASSVAPDNPLLGTMLPCTPLHHLLLNELGFPIVATSGNVADEPLIIDERAALNRLCDIADVFLVHDRLVACPLDDSVVRAVAGRPLMLRRARGYAPLSLRLPRRSPPILALGGHLKSSSAISVGSQVIIGPHIGDLNTAPARRVYNDGIDRLREVLATRPVAIACDHHPDYYTTTFAKRSGLPVIQVQHHLAHILGCMADNDLDEPVLGVAWDGTGYGEDAIIWGGEFIIVDGTSVRRAAHLRPFLLPGGDKAVSEPRRAAIGLLYELFGAGAMDDCSLAPCASFSPVERKLLMQMLAQGINAPQTSSIGRLFDAVASLIGLIQCTSFEGQAAMALEFAIQGAQPRKCYNLPLDVDRENPTAPLVLDWRPMVIALIADIKQHTPIAQIAAAFHDAMIEAIVAVAEQVGQKRVVLSGGCFQNRYLTEGAVERLKRAGLEPFWHRQVPPNDGGLALGQIVWASRMLPQGAL